MQRLIIKNFGPIEELDLEVKDFMVLVGPQASGKSTVAKLVYFFKKLRDELIKDFLNYSPMDYSQMMQHLGEDARLRFRDIWGDDIQQGNGFVEFHYSAELSIGLKPIKPMYSDPFKVVSFSFSTGFKEKIDEARKELNEIWKAIEAKKSANSSTLERLESEWSREVSERIISIFGDDRALVFIPAGRIFLSTFDFTMAQGEVRAADFFMADFSRLVRFIKPVFVRSLLESLNRLAQSTGLKSNQGQFERAIQIVEEILGGQYHFEKDNEYLKLKSGQKISLSQTSSGQQESLWILYLLLYFIANNDKVLVIVEEPEAHIYPKAQKAIVDLLSIFYKIEGGQNSVVITTHSPYILGAINAHLLAGQVGAENPDGANEITPDWLDSNRTAALLLENGKATSIIDDELGIIKNESIDGISRTLNRAFDHLIDLKYSR